MWALNSTFGQNNGLTVVKVICSGLGADASFPGLCDHHTPPSLPGPVGDVLGLVRHAAVDYGRRGPYPVSCHHFAECLAPDCHGGVYAYVNRPHRRLA